MMQPFGVYSLTVPRKVWNICCGTTRTNTLDAYQRLRANMSIKVHLLHNLDGFLANCGYVSKMNDSTKILKKWKKDVKEVWTLEWWQTIATVSNTTTQMPTIHTSHKKQSSYQKIPVPLWNKTLTYAIVIELLFNTNQKILFFSCVCIVLMCWKRTR